MLSLISLGRGAWAKFQSAHPVIKWGGAILVGLVVLEFIAQEAISLYVHMQTARATIERQNAEAAQAAYEARVKKLRTDVDVAPAYLTQEQKKKSCASKEATANCAG